MAGEWIKVESATPNKPEVLRAARKLGVDKDLVVGKLLRLWTWFDQNSVDGVVDGVVSTDVDAVVGLDGFSCVMESVGWLETDDELEVVRLPNFDTHNGETAKKRGLKNKRQTRWRQNKDSHVDTPTSTNASTREEKRREENNKPAGEKPARSSSGAVEIKTFLANHKAADEKPIPPDDPIFDYASETGIPQEFLRLCWLEFVERNQASGKRQKDWRAAFRNCVRGNWYKLWWIDGADYCLTTTGKQAEAKHGSTGRAA